MADIDFGGGKGFNMSDPRFDNDAVNYRTLLRVVELSGGGTSSITGTVISVGQSTNILTGGTAAKPTIATSLNPTFTSLNSTTLSGGTIFSAGTNLYNVFATIGSINQTFVQEGSNIYSGGTDYRPSIHVVDSPSFNNITLSGTGLAIGFSATTLSGGTITSGSTNLNSIFTWTRVQPGNNITTGATLTSPTINVVDSPSFNGITLSGAARAISFSATTLSGGTIYSAGTDLSLIFVTHDNNDITRVQPGNNITTGGTVNAPIVNLVDNPSINSLTASGSSSFATLSATTLISGSTDLYNIFSTTDTNDITRVQPGTNITTGGTANNPSVSLFKSPSVDSFTASGSSSFTTLSATTIISGSTDLSLLFITNDNNDITRVQPGSNITTGGTANAPIVNVADSPSFNGIVLSGSGIAARAISFSATTFSGGTIFSGSNNLSNIFVYSGSNIGSAEEVFKEKKDGGILEFRTLSANNMSVTTVGDIISIGSTNTRTVSGVLAINYTFTDCIYEGSVPATWTLPELMNNIRFNIMNIGSDSITLNSNMGGNDIYDMVGATATNSITINANKGYLIVGNGTYWIACNLN